MRLLTVLLALTFSSAAIAQTTQHVAARMPVLGQGHELSAERAVNDNGGPRQYSINPATANAWKLLATLPGAVIHDLSFPTPQIGYVAAELGQVWKTTDGGKTWTEIVNLGFPYYWYGVDALDANDVVISGFNDSNFEGVLRWSHDGGTTWTSDIVVTTAGWCFRTRFVNRNDGLIVDGLNLNAANAAHYTTDGGQNASDWTEVVPDPSGGWFGNEFSLLPNLHAQMSGITYCSSTNGGQTWTCGPPVDSVFDGPTFFANEQDGWVGGGEISPSVEGWVHRTTDGGNTWSARTLDGPWPIREILFLSGLNGWAAGGNVYTGVGGIYFSRDGGQTWSVDVTTNAEMSGCDSKKSGTHFHIWCAGTDASFNGVVYSLRR